MDVKLEFSLEGKKGRINLYVSEGGVLESTRLLSTVHPIGVYNTTFRKLEIILSAGVKIPPLSWVCDSNDKFYTSN
jgi:hypothetical protein